MLGERWPEAQGGHRFRSKALTQRRGRSSCQSLCSEFSEWPEPEGGAGLGSGAGTAASRLGREAVLAPSVALQKLSNLQVLRLHVVSSYCCSPLPVIWIARTFILPSLADSEDWRFLIDTDKQPFALNAQGNVFLCHAQRDCVNITVRFRWGTLLLCLSFQLLLRWVLAQTCSRGTWEVEAGGLYLVPDQPGIQYKILP